MQREHIPQPRGLTDNSSAMRPEKLSASPTILGGCQRVGQIGTFTLSRNKEISDVELYAILRAMGI